MHNYFVFFFYFLRCCTRRYFIISIENDQIYLQKILKLINRSNSKMSMRKMDGVLFLCVGEMSMANADGGMAVQI